MPTLSETSSSSNSSSSEDENEDSKLRNAFPNSTTEQHVPQSQIHTDLDVDLETQSQNISVDIQNESIHFPKANEMRKQYRFKYNLLRERCDAIRQDNEQLVSRIWEVDLLSSNYIFLGLNCYLHFDLLLKKVSEKCPNF